MVDGQTKSMTNNTIYNHEAYLDEAGCDAGAGGHHGLETAVVHHEVAHCNIQETCLSQMEGRKTPGKS